MRPFKLSFNLTSLAGGLLTLPALYFIFISIMKYVFGWEYLFDVSAPVLGKMGIKESLGWNINLLILFGPLLALLLNMLSVLHIHIETTRDKIDCRFSITKNWKNLAVVLLSTSVLFTLFVYQLGENCSCI